MTLTHDELAADLAGHLRGPSTMVWTNLQLGPSGSPRPDVYAIDKSFVNPRPRAYEVKVSLADFRADATAGKWMSYRCYAGAVYFAVPAGLISREEIPPTCGLLVRGDTGWRAWRRATLAPVKIPEATFMKLLIDGVEREGPVYRRKRWGSSDGFSKKYGVTAARYVAEAASAEQTIAAARDDAERILDRARVAAAAITEEAQRSSAPLWERLLVALELPADATPWTVQSAVARLEAARGGSRELTAIRRVLRELDEWRVPC